MLFAPTPLGAGTLPADRLRKDFDAKKKTGPCGLGREAVYLNSFFIDCRYYVCYRDISRVFKRVAISKGAFRKRGVFGSLPYLVVLLTDGREIQCNFKYEEDVDAFLREIKHLHPDIPTMSAKAEKQLAEERAAEEARYVKNLSPEAENTIRSLKQAKAFLLEDESGTADRLSAAARNKRIMDQLNPAYQYAACGIFLLAAGALAIGIISVFRRESYAMYLILFGMAFLFSTMSAQILPTGKRNRKNADRMWREALADSAALIAEYPGFPLPAQYAHPAALSRMIRVIREGRAETAAEARRVMEEDLRAINSSVTVSQTEYDEITAIKPMYLICDYRDDYS